MPASIVDQELKRVAIGMCIQRKLSYNGTVAKMFKRLQIYNNEEHKKKGIAGRVGSVLGDALKHIAKKNKLSTAGSADDIYERCKANGINATGDIQSTIKAVQTKKAKKLSAKHLKKTELDLKKVIWSVTAPAEEVHRITNCGAGTTCSFTNGQKAILAKGSNGFYWKSCK